ncbi:MAG: hypothetical protein ACHQX4_08975 [Gemmatimonadales bacterium]
MMRTAKLVLVGLMVMGAAACSDSLNVANTQSADRARALARPSDVEALIGSSYSAVHNATLGAFCAINTQSMSMSLENYSNLANNNMGPRAAIPRAPVDNSRNNAVAASNYRDFLNLHRAARQAAVGLAAVNATGFTFFPPNASQLARARAMSYFVIGTALGNVALLYDQGSAISPNDNPNDPTPIPFVAYDSLMRYSLTMLDSAIAEAGLAAGSFPLTSSQNWFGAPGVAMTQAQFIGFARGYKARFRAGVARDPTSRAAVNWANVIADANAALAAWPGGVVLPMLPASGWDIGYLSTIFQSNQQSWTMMWAFIIGMADTSGGYQNWVATANTSKLPFLVVTNDLRYPQGLTRTAQQGPGCPAACTSGQGTAAAPMPAGQYIRNRAVSDWNGDPYANSWYDHERWNAFVRASRIGNFPIMPATELRMLAAEGDILTGAIDAAATLINVTRTANGLTALPAGMTLATPVPGSANGCIPKIPAIVAAGTGTVACGTIMEAMKWEKRMETEFTAPYAWYIDARGWGDLPVNTATEWPTPYQEIDSRQLFANPPAYTLSFGGGGPSSALANTYGLH